MYLVPIPLLPKTMKKIVAIAIFASFTLGAAQESELEVQKTIETFFEGFHAQDSMLIKQTVANDIIMQRIAVNEKGETLIRTDDFHSFLRAIVGIPKDRPFKETIKSYSIQIDGPMANAWTPYEFWLNDAFHHCGVNSFQLAQIEGAWKIIYLVDTGHAAPCN